MAKVTARGRVKKRAFKRDRGLLTDVVVDWHGAELHAQLHGTMLGEPLSAEARAERIAELTTLDPRDGSAALALRDDQGADVLDALLASLARGGSAAPMALLAFADDPRVRPALLRAFELAPHAQDLGNLAQVLGLAGGPGALAALRLRGRVLAKMSPLVEHGYDHIAGERAIVAGAILGLDPDDTEAARLLVELGQGPQQAAWLALHRAADVVCGPLSTAARALLEHHLAPMLDGDTPRHVLTAGKALVKRQRERVLARVRTLLAHADPMERMYAAYFIAKPETRADGRTFGSLLKWLRDQPIFTAITVAECDATRIPLVDLTKLVRRALAHDSPWVRHRGLGLLADLPEATARTLARGAAVDEPDPALRRLLRAISAVAKPAKAPARPRRPARREKPLRPRRGRRG